MAQEGLCELLRGVTREPAHGFALTIGAGGVITEVIQDTVSLLVPSETSAVDQALNQLNCAPILKGYRGKPPVDRAALLQAIDALQSYVLQNADVLCEVEINPLICAADGVVAVDALIRKG